MIEQGFQHLSSGLCSKERSKVAEDRVKQVGLGPRDKK